MRSALPWVSALTEPSLDRRYICPPSPSGGGVSLLLTGFLNALLVIFMSFYFPAAFQFLTLSLRLRSSS